MDKNVTTNKNKRWRPKYKFMNLHKDDKRSYITNVLTKSLYRNPAYKRGLTDRATSPVNALAVWSGEEAILSVRLRIGSGVARFVHPVTREDSRPVVLWPPRMEEGAATQARRRGYDPSARRRGAGRPPAPNACARNAGQSAGRRSAKRRAQAIRSMPDAGQGARSSSSTTVAAPWVPLHPAPSSSWSLPSLLCSYSPLPFRADGVLDQRAAHQPRLPPRCPLHRDDDDYVYVAWPMDGCPWCSGPCLCYLRPLYRVHLCVGLVESVLCPSVNCKFVYPIWQSGLIRSIKIWCCGICAVNWGYFATTFSFACGWNCRWLLIPCIFPHCQLKSIRDSLLLCMSIHPGGDSLVVSNQVSCH